MAASCTSSPAPSCRAHLPAAEQNVAWDFVWLVVSYDPLYIVDRTFPFETVCNGMAQMQSTYGDNRIGDFVHDDEGHMLAGGVVYAINFTVYGGTTLRQISIDILNSTHLNKWVWAHFGIYDPTGVLLSEAVPLAILEPQDAMVVTIIDPLYINTTGLYYVAIKFDHDIFVAQGVDGSGVMMKFSGQGLPDTFIPDGVSGAPPLSVYGCVAASHYFCATFQYYQGDNYSPWPSTTSTTVCCWQRASTAPTRWASGSPCCTASATSPPTYALLGGVTTISQAGLTCSLLDRATLATIISTRRGNGGATLDGVGISFLTSDDFGGQVTFTYDPTSGVYVDSTDPELGAQLLVNFTLRPVDRSVGLPQCAYLYLPQDVEPASALANSSVCAAGTQPVVWGDDNRQDFFYTEEGFYPTYYTDIVLTPFKYRPHILEHHSAGPSRSVRMPTCSLTCAQHCTSVRRSTCWPRARR